MDKNKIVIESIASEYKITVEQLMGKSRLKHIAKPRKMACFMLYHPGGMSLNQVAKYMGYADHTTALYHVNDYWYLCKCDDEFDEIGKRIFSQAIDVYETN